MIATPWLSVIIGGTIAAVLTPPIALLAKKTKTLDVAESAPDRKRHKHPVPLLGGVALFFSFILVTLIIQQDLFGGYLLPKHVIGLLSGMGLLALGGALDDKFDLPAWQQILFPVGAAVAVIASGIGISYIDNPVGPDLDLSVWTFELFSRGGVPYQVVILADLFTLGWLLLMTYTTKLLDGIDGLVSGLGVAASLVLFFLSLSSGVMQPETGLLAGGFAGVCLGFLLWNWHPARIYLGEGGSTIIGFTLGALAIISGAKIATTILIISLPIIDHAYVVFRRVLAGRNPFTRADRSHLHHRLVDAGVPTPLVAFGFIAVSTIFGLLSIALPRNMKGYALLVGGIFVIVWILWAVKRDWQQRSSSSSSS